MIEATGISKSFFDRPLFDSLSLTIEDGEAFVLVGPSGAGKSVLMKIMCGLITPNTGEVRLGGTSRDVGMLFQNNALFDSFTVEENLLFPMRELGLFDEPERFERVESFLSAVGLSGTNQLNPNDLSGGMQKRLGIARALIVDPKIIFYDDPTAGLDPITSKKIVALIIDLKKKYNSTVMMVTNDMNRAYQIGDRIGLLAGGVLTISGSPEETRATKDPRVHQFIYGELKGPLTEDFE